MGMADLSDLDQSFAVTIHKPISIEERSREMLKKEQRAIFLRALLAVVTAIPSLIIGVVYMNLVSKHDKGYMYLMHPLQGVSRAEWANFIMATPVYFFAADHFHRRMLKAVVLRLGRISYHVFTLRQARRSSHEGKIG